MKDFVPLKVLKKPINVLHCSAYMYHSYVIVMLVIIVFLGIHKCTSNPAIQCDMGWPLPKIRR